MFGSAKADPLIAAIGSAADTVFDLISPTWHRLRSTRPAGSNPRIAQGHARAGSTCPSMDGRSAPARLMDGAEVARHIGTGAYVGGWKDGGGFIR
jgi:hypothetical protein